MGCGELVTANKPTVATKPLFDPIVVEDGQDDGRLSNSASANQGDWCEVLGETNDLLDQLVTPKEDPWWWRW